MRPEDLVGLTWRPTKPARTNPDYAEEHNNGNRGPQQDTTGETDEQKSKEKNKRMIFQDYEESGRAEALGCQVR